MNDFFKAPMPRFYAEALQYMKNAGGQAKDTGNTAGEKPDVGSFAETVQNKLASGEQEAQGVFADAAKRAKEWDSVGLRKGGRRTGSSRKKKEESYWEKRAKRRKLYMDLAQKAWYRRENERKYQERIALGRKEVSSALLKQRAMERATGEPAELDANPSVLSEAATDFAQGYIFFKIPSALINPRPKSAK